MNINIIARIAMGIYKHQEDPNVQVSYRAKKIWIKGKKGWSEYSFSQIVKMHAPDNTFIHKLIKVV